MRTNPHHIVIVGGGAAGFFAAITAAEAAPGGRVTLLERGPQLLAKVRISGGGRCNVTHACFDGREFATRYPRGGQALIGAFQRFQASDTVAWFESRGVKLKTESDGRMFPVTDDSETIVECLVRAARAAGVSVRTNCGVDSVRRTETGFELVLTGGGSVFPPPQGGAGGGENSPKHFAPCSWETERRLQAAGRASPQGHLLPPEGGVPKQIHGGESQAISGSKPLTPALSPLGRGEGVGSAVETRAGKTIFCDRLLLATGGCRAAVAGQLAASLGHAIEAPVPSLFTFSIALPWLKELAGASVELAEVNVPGTDLRERGPLLVTHWGLSGPVVLRLSAWGARELHALDYKFPLLVNWLPQFTMDALAKEFSTRRQAYGAKLVVNAPIAPLTARLWEALVQAAGVSRETRWAALTRTQQHQLAQQLTRTEFAVTGKSLNKDEFVTCGGVKLGEVNFKTMESRVCPGLYFAGELLDIDGITGGFNFQAAWTTGWIAGKAMAGVQAGTW